MRIKNADLEKKQNLLFSAKEKEKDIEKISKELKEKENIINDLNNKHKAFDKQNNELKKNISDLTKKKDNLGKEIDELEKALIGKKNLINDNNNLNKQIIDLKAKLKQKEKEIESNKNSNKEEMNKIKNEKEKEINELKQENKKMKKFKNEGQLLQNKEQEISKKMKELDEKEKKVIKLYDQYKDLEKINASLGDTKSDLEKQKEKLIKEIKQYEQQLSQKKSEFQRMNNQNNNNNNIIINNGAQAKPLQNQNQINQNINNQQFQNNPQNFMPNNNINQITPMFNNFFPFFNQNPSAQMSNFMTTPMGNNNNVNITPNTPLQPLTPPSIFPIYVPPAPRKPTGVIATYEKPTLIGLNNIGSTCYKNSVLQCLSQTHDLTNYILKEENKEKIINNNIAKKNNRELQLCPIYYDLIKNLWKKNASLKSFSPLNFMKSVETMTKNDTVQFSLNEAGDAKDFIIFILERMHTELKKPLIKQMQKHN